MTVEWYTAVPMEPEVMEVVAPPIELITFMILPLH